MAARGRNRAQNLAVVYTVDLLDRGTKHLLAEDRKVRRQVQQSSKAMAASSREASSASAQVAKAKGREATANKGLTSATTAVARSTTSAAKASRTATTELKHTSLAAQQTSRSFDQVDASSSRAARGLAKVRDGGREAGKGLVDISTRLPLIKWGAFTAGALGAGAGAVTLASNLTPVAGIVGALPGAMLGAATATTTAKLAFTGFGDVTEEMTKALAKPTPRMQQFGKELDRYASRIRRLQNTAARGLLPGVEKGLQSASRNLPVVDRALSSTSREMGRLVAMSGKELGSKRWGRDLEAVASSNTKVLGNLGRSGIQGANALRHVSVEARPLNEWLGRSTENWSRYLNAQARAARESGRMERYFDRTRTTLTLTGRTVLNTAVGIRNIGQEANRVSGNDGMLRWLERGSKSMRTWTGSARGRGEIRKFFQTAEDGAKGAGRSYERMQRTYSQQRFGEGKSPGQAFARSFSKEMSSQLPKLLTNVAEHAGSIFVAAFLGANVFGKLIIGGWLLKKLGGGAAVAAIGRRVGGNIATPMANSITSGVQRRAGAIRSGLGRTLGRAGTSAGQAGGRAAGASMASTTATRSGSSISRTMGRQHGSYAAAGRGAGRAAGRSAGISAASSTASTSAGAIGGATKRRHGSYSSAGRGAGRAMGASAGALGASTMVTGTSAGVGRSAKGGRLAGGMRAAGRGVGKLFGAAMVASVVLMLPDLVKQIRDALKIKPGKGKFGQYSGSNAGGRDGKEGYKELARDIWDYLPGKDHEQKRGGGMTASAMVALSPGELGVTPSGQAFEVPGGRVAADSVLASVPTGTAIYTGHGQSLLARGASPDEALAQQLPHFRAGGVVPSYRRGGHVFDSQTKRIGSGILRTGAGMGTHWRHGLASLAAGMTETGGPGRANGAISNPAGGHGTSAGVFQMTNDKGSVAQRRNIGFASRWFFTTAKGVNPKLPIGKISQLVERSAFPGRYAQYADDAESLAHQLGYKSGRRARLVKAGGQTKRPQSTRRGADGATTRTIELQPKLGFGGGLPSRRAAFAAGYQGDVAPLWDNDLMPDISVASRANFQRRTRTITTPGRARPGSGPGNDDRSEKRGGSPTRVKRLIREMHRIDKMRKPYVYGGGHTNPAPAGGPWDCSSAVARAFQGSGIKWPTGVSGGYMRYGKAGRGKYTAVMSNPGHTYMAVRRKGGGWRAWGTSGMNPGGSPGWVSGGGYPFRGGFVTRHPPGFRGGGLVGHRAGGRVAPVSRSLRVPVPGFERHRVRSTREVGRLVDRLDDGWLGELERRWRVRLARVRRGGITRKERPEFNYMRKVVGAVDREQAERVAGRLKRLSDAALTALDRRTDSATRRIRRGGVSRRERGTYDRLTIRARAIDSERSRRRDVREPWRPAIAQLVGSPSKDNAASKGALKRFADAISLLDRETIAILGARATAIEQEAQALSRTGSRRFRRTSTGRLRSLARGARRQMALLRRGGLRPGERRGFRSAQRQLSRIGRERGVRAQARAQRGQARAIRAEIGRGRPDYGQLERIEADLGRRVARLRRGGETQTERVQIRRLESAMRLVNVEMGRRTKMIVEASERQATVLERQRTRLGQHLRLGNISEDSSLGLASLERLQRAQNTALRRTQRELSRALNRALKVGDREAVKDLTERIEAINEEIYEGATSVAETVRSRIETIAREKTETAAFGTSWVNAMSERLELGQRLKGTFETGGAQRADTITKYLIPSLQREVAALYGQFAAARLTGNQALAKEIAEALWAKENEVLQAQLTAQETIAENTQQKETVGSTTFEYGSQRLTDLIALDVGG